MFAIPLSVAHTVDEGDADSSDDSSVMDGSWRSSLWSMLIRICSSSSTVRDPNRSLNTLVNIASPSLSPHPHHTIYFFGHIPSTIIVPVTLLGAVSLDNFPGVSTM